MKIAISLSEDLLQQTERERHARQETRSQFFRQAVEAFLCRERERKDDERYVQAYREMPETDEEIAAARASARKVLAEESWD